MLDDLWFVAEGGAWSGPFTSEEMGARVSDGRFAGALLWKPGWGAWAPISAHFPVQGAAPSIGAASQAAPAAPPPPSGRGVTLAVWAMALAVAALGVLLFTSINYVRFGLAGAYIYAGVWGLGVLLVLAIAVLTWRRAAIPGTGWPWQMGKALSAIAVIGALAFCVVFVRVTIAIHDVSEARRTFANYQLAYDPVTRVITFSGPIGPGFADRLNGILNSNAGVRVLRIANSPGGLIDEAMSAAARIERETGLAVEADGECNSACLALFMAANDRRAEYTAEFGFHRTGMISDVPAFVRAGADESANAFRLYVIQRGVPGERYDDWARSEELHAVSAIELRDLRIVGQLLSDGVSVDAMRAKWLWIATVSAATDNGFADLARALADSNEPTALQAAAPIFTAVRAGDNAAIRSSTLALLPGLLPKVLESADPETTIAYLGASTASIDYLVSMEQWDDCASIIDGRGVDPHAVPNSVVRGELTALATAVRSAAASAWVSHPLPSWAASAGTRVINATVVEASREGIDNRQYTTDPRVRCLLTHRLLHRVMRGDPTTSIVAYRWILAH